MQLKTINSWFFFLLSIPWPFLIKTPFISYLIPGSRLIPIGRVCEEPIAVNRINEEGTSSASLDSSPKSLYSISAVSLTSRSKWNKKPTLYLMRKYSTIAYSTHPEPKTSMGIWFQHFCTNCINTRDDHRKLNLDSTYFLLTRGEFGTMNNPQILSFTENLNKQLSIYEVRKAAPDHYPASRAESPHQGLVHPQCFFTWTWP